MFDYLFFRNVIHHLQNRINYFKSLSSTLKPNGKIVIIEYDGKAGFFSFQRFYRHFIPKDILFEEIKHTGYKLQKSYDFLSEQSFSIFSLN